MPQSAGNRAGVRVIPRHRVTLALIGCWAVFFAAQLLDTGGIPYERDLTQLYLPLRYFLHDRLKSGHLPHWFPYELIGVPFLGQIVTATFHPQTLLFLPLTPATALKFNILLAYLWGAGGAYRFARALNTTRTAGFLGAISLAFTGYGLSLHNNPPYLMGMMTLPWVGWRAVRLADRERPRDVAALSLMWALVFLGGDIQGTGFATVLILAALAARSRSRRAPLLALLATGLMLLLISIELLPATAVFRDTFRLVTNVGDAPVRVWAMHPLRLLELVLPGFFVHGREAEFAGHLLGTGSGGLWATSVFAGSVVTAFLALGISRSRSAVAFAAVWIVALWMALGVYGGLLPVVFRLIPALSHFAYPEKYLALASVAAVPLVAFGFDRASLPGVRRFVPFGALALLTIAAATRLAPSPGDEWAELIRASWRTGMLTSVGLCAAAAAAIVVGTRYRYLSFLPIAVCFVELWRANAGLITLADRALFETPTPIAAKVQESVGPGKPIARVAAVPAAGFSGLQMRTEPDRWARSNVEALKPDAASVWKVGTIGMALLPALPSRMLSIAAEEPTSWSRWLHACWRTIPVGALPFKDEKVVLSDEEANIVLVSQPCYPYAFTAGALPVTDPADALRHLNQGIPPNMILWENGPIFARAHAHVDLNSFEPGLVTLSATSDNRSALVIGEGYSPGWTATIDGTPAVIYPTNLVAQGIEIPAGKHEVRFEYRTPRLAAGAALSVLGLVLLVLLFRLGRKAESTRSPA